ncbi:hypothetical protein [Streptomyces sp. NPDC052114]|uniref:hypothetical protein n=1 Tax=unclassified Streptomyces TaxID=2593676 RepID=UPI00342F8482
MSERRLGVVLVHGIRSSSAMWDPLRGLIAADDGLGSVETLPYEYATGVFRLNPTRTFPSFDTAADGLKEFLDTQGADFPRLMVIAHSQGGLIVQRCLARMLAEGRGRDLARIGRVVLLACPNNGSEFLLSLRRRFFGRSHPQETQLRPYDEQITDTQATVLHDIVLAREVTDRTCPIPFKAYVAESDNIVKAASARSVFRDVGTLRGGHSTVARPDSTGHPTYRTLRRLILETADTDPPDRPGPLPAVPIRDAALDATALGVHRVIDTAAPTADLTPQPPYLLREHDTALRHAVSGAADGRSRLAVLVGGSSTGKTRACFEALALLGPEWRLWRPPSADDLAAGLAGRPRLPRTVVWLDETQRCLTSSAEDPAARALQSLLDDPARGPVLVLGTLWPEHHKELTGHGAHPAARLLKDRQIHLTDTGFRTASEADVMAAVADDPRLAEAFTAGRDQATQYLAGGRELVARYESTPETRALVDAAVDAARLGRVRDVTEAFLAPAAWALLPEPYVRTRPPDWPEGWFRRALTDAGEPCRGVPGPLTTLGTAPDEPSPDVRTYQLADYLAQRVAAERRLLCPPDAWWEAAGRHVSAPRHLLALAEAARARGRYRVSALLAQRALDADPSVRAHDLLVVLHHGAGHPARAARVAEQALAQGDEHPALVLAELLRAQGDVDQAVVWQRRAAAGAADKEAAWDALAATLLASGDVEGAMRAGEHLPRWRLGAFTHDLGAAGHGARALAFARRLAAEGRTEALVAVAKGHEAEGRLQDAIDLLDEPDRLDSARAYEYLTDLREEAGDPRGAEDAGRRAAGEHRYGKALKRLAWRRAEAGDPRGAGHAMLALASCPDWGWWALVASTYFFEAKAPEAAAAAAERAVAGGWPEGWVQLAHLAAHRGDLSGVERALAQATATEDGDVWEALGDFHQDQGRVEEADAAYRRAIGLGRHSAYDDLAALWHDAGDLTRRDDVISEALAAGRVGSLRPLPEFFADADDHATARAQALRAVEHGDEGAGLFLTRRWLQVDRTADALALAKDLTLLGHDQALNELVQVRWEASDFTTVIDAVEFVRGAGGTEERLIVGYLAAAHAATGAAEAFERTLKALRSSAPLLHAGELCEQRGLRAEALAAYEGARAHGDGRALPALARLHADDPPRARALLHRAVDAGAPNALELLVAHHESARDPAAARRVRRYGVTADGPAPAW